MSDDEGDMDMAGMGGREKNLEKSMDNWKKMSFTHLKSS